MGYNPNTGTWEYADDSVEGRVKGLVDVNSPLIQQARTQGMETANRRGLINSSIAVGASQDAAYKAAVPIAVQDASQTSAKNLSAQGNVQTQQQQAITIQGQKDVQGQSDAAANQRLVEQLGSQERVAAAQDAAAKDRLGLQLTSEESNLVKQLNNAKDIATAGNQNSLTIATQGNTNAKDIAIAGNQTQHDIAQINAGSVDRSTAAQTQTAAATSINQVNSTYATEVNAINANPDINPTARINMLASLEQGHRADLNMIATIYNIQVDYTPPVVPGQGRDPTDPPYT